MDYEKRTSVSHKSIHLSSDPNLCPRLEIHDKDRDGTHTLVSTGFGVETQSKVRRDFIPFDQ